VLGVTSTAVEVTPTAQDLAGKALDNLASGFIAFNPAAAMRVGILEPLKVQITRARELTNEVRKTLTVGLPAPPAPVLAAGAQAAAPNTAAAPQVEGLGISDAMTLTLTGADFRIDAVTPAKQAVGPTGTVTLWEWDVTPLRSGRRILRLCASVDIATPEGFQPSTRACPFERQIRVRVNALFSIQTFVKGNLTWLGPALITAVVAGFGLLRSLKKRKAKEPAKHSLSP
jgi:hypothetical protein